MNHASAAAQSPPGVAWQARGACQAVEPDLFFPLSEASASAAEIASAKAVCASCPVRPECLRFAMTTRQPHGIWGGLTEHERARLRRSGGPPAAPGTRRPAALPDAAMTLDTAAI